MIARWISWSMKYGGAVAACVLGPTVACGFPDVTFDGAGDAGDAADTLSNSPSMGQPWNEAGTVESNDGAMGGDSAPVVEGGSRTPDAAVVDTAAAPGDGSDGGSGAIGYGSRADSGTVGGGSSGGNNGSASSGSSASGATSSSSGGRGSGGSNSGSGGGSGGTSASSGSSGGASSSGGGTGASSSSSGGASSSGGSGGGASSGGGSSSGGGGDDAGHGGSSGGGGAGCVCANGLAPYPTGFDCTAIAIDPSLPPGQAKKACKNAGGFLDATLACGQLGTYVTCDAVADVLGIGFVCRVASSAPAMQQCQ